MTCACAPDVADVGTTVRVPTVFHTLTDPPVLVDPTTVSLFIKDPNGVEDVLTPVRDSLGEYHGEVVVPVAGQWHWRFEATNPKRAVEGSFVVRRSEYEESSGTPPEEMTWETFELLTWYGLDELEWGSL